MEPSFVARPVGSTTLLDTMEALAGLHGSSSSSGSANFKKRFIA
jgi:hypothetical protein